MHCALIVGCEGCQGFSSYSYLMESPEESFSFGAVFQIFGTTDKIAVSKVVIF